LNVVASVIVVLNAV